MTPQLLAEKVNTLFSLPDVALRVNELLNEDNTTNADLEEIILHDPALTAQLLKFVNSAFFGFPGKIDTISRAVSMIGQSELRNLVVATTVTESFNSIPEHLVDMNTFWYHSVTSGVLARMLAQQCNRLDRERFFIAGLLHSIGKLMIFCEYPEQSVQILALKDQGRDAMINTERALLGFTYAEAGAELLKKWKLPGSIWEMINHQLAPLHAEQSIEDACILHIAADIADSIEPCAKMDIEFDDPELNYDSPAYQFLQLQTDQVLPVIHEAGYQAYDILGIIRPEATVIF